MNLNLSFETLPFMSKTKTPLGKMIEHSIKRGLSNVFACPVKWSRLPVVFKSASALELKRLRESLVQFAQLDGILSDERHVEKVTERQFAIVQRIKDTFR